MPPQCQPLAYTCLGEVVRPMAISQRPELKGYSKVVCHLTTSGIPRYIEPFIAWISIDYFVPTILQLLSFSLTEWFVLCNAIKSIKIKKHSVALKTWLFVEASTQQQ